MNPKSALDLRWVRIFDPQHIPKSYINQIKDRDWSVEDFLAYQRSSSMIKGDNGIYTINPSNFLYVLLDDDNVVKGFCWMVADDLSRCLVINSYSLDNEYWGSGKAVEALKDQALCIKEKLEFDKIYWITRCPRHSEKYGFKRSKHVLMEYRDGQDTTRDEQAESDRRSVNSHSSAREFHQLPTERSVDGGECPSESSSAIQ